MIARTGHAERFLHRTGHGIGLDVHEPPFLVAGSSEPLRAGAALAVEPGIYERGAYGVRLEDDVLVTDSGYEPLAELDSALWDCLSGRPLQQRGVRQPQGRRD